MIGLHFTMTAMPRPGILRKTLQSFKNNLYNCDFGKSTLYINIDPFIDSNANKERLVCIKLASDFFGTVISNLPNTPNFSTALKWCWQNANEDIIFNLEDDWELLEIINVEDLYRTLVASEAKQLLLRGWSWNRYPFCLSPGLIKRDFYKDCLTIILSDVNPEATIQRSLLNSNYKNLVFPNDRVILKDLGRNWIKNSGYVRGKGDFICWQKETKSNKIFHSLLADQNQEIAKKF